MAAAILAVWAPAGVASAGAATVQDASCPGPISQNIGGYQLAQTFTAKTSGAISRVDASILNVSDAGATPHVFQIRAVASGVPTKQVLASTTLSAGAVEAVVPVDHAGKSACRSPAPPSSRVGRKRWCTRGRTKTPSSRRPSAPAKCPGMNLFFKASSGASFQPERDHWVFSTFVTDDRCAGKTPTMVGTAGDDTLRGSRNADVILAYGGDDIVKGFGGADVVSGGAGDDIVKGARGSDRLSGQRGMDSHSGGGGHDRCAGGKGEDSTSGCEVERSI